MSLVYTRMSFVCHSYFKSYQIKHIYCHFIVLRFPLKSYIKINYFMEFQYNESVSWGDEVTMLVTGDRAEKSSTFWKFEFSLNENILENKHKHIHTPRYIHIHIHIDAMDINIHTYTHTYTYICVYILYIYTYIHIRI